MSEQKSSYEVEGIVRRALRQDVSRQRSGEVYQKMSAALKGPKNKGASIIFKWTKFGTITTLPRADHPAKLSNRGRRALVREVPKNLMVTLTELQSSSVEMGEPFLKDNHHFTNQAFMVEWPDGSHSSAKGKRHMTASLEFGLMKPRLSVTFGGNLAPSLR